jgi:hypothetical protein
MNSKVFLIPSVLLLVVTLFSGMIAGKPVAAIDPFKNKINIITDSNHNNDCDEDDTGTNNAACVDIDQTSTKDISIKGDKNKVTSDIKVDQVQKCDENEAGNNNVECTNSSINFLDSIDVSGNNNNINYDINTKQINDCDDKEMEITRPNA